VTEEPKLVCVRRCQGMDVAQIYKSKLEAMEIPVLLEYESAGLVFGITVDGLGEVRIMVPEAYAAEAEALLSEVPDDQPWPELDGVAEEQDSDDSVAL
jgi:hypothetical protein